MDRRSAIDILGLPNEFGADDVTAARRRAARHAHPDAGGSAEHMVLVNQAADFLLNHDLSNEDRIDVSVSRPDLGCDGLEIDRPSFVVDVLPVDAFWWILMAAHSLGQVIDEDPPYALEVLIESRPDGWCRLDIVPDAGSSTVSIMTDGRDPSDLVPLFVGAINELSDDGAVRFGEPPP